MGNTLAKRKTLLKKAGMLLDTVLEFIKLSDLARISGLKAIRARLYYDAGVDTIGKLAQWDPEKLHLMFIEYIEQSGFEGIAPPAEENKIRG